MEISKTTYNFAGRRNIELYEMDGELHFTVNPDENECSSAVYEIASDKLHLARCFEPCIGDLPVWIEDEATLRNAIQQIGERSGYRTAI